MNRFILALIVAFMSLFTSTAGAVVVQTTGSGLSSSKHAIAAWILNETRGRVEARDALNIVNEAYKAGSKWNVDPLLLLAIMKKESTYNANARNKRSNASGLMQVIPRWHKDKIQGRSMFNTRANIDVGAQIVSEYLQWHGESSSKAMRRYTGGAGSAYGAVVQRTYKELRDVVFGWKMANDDAVRGEYKYGHPRHYATTSEAYLQAEQTRVKHEALDRLITQHAQAVSAYRTALN